MEKWNLESQLRGAERQQLIDTLAELILSKMDAQTSPPFKVTHTMNFNATIPFSSFAIFKLKRTIRKELMKALPNIPKGRLNILVRQEPICHYGCVLPYREYGRSGPPYYIQGYCMEFTAILDF